MNAFTDEDLASASNGFETLGPAWFAARRASEHLMAGEDTKPFKEMVDKVAKQLSVELYEYAENYIKGDLEHNLQIYISDMVNDTVHALLTGQQWALDRYPLSKYHDGESIRKAIAAYCGESVLALRVKELEAENERLREDLRWRR